MRGRNPRIALRKTLKTVRVSSRMFRQLKKYTHKNAPIYGNNRRIHPHPPPHQHNGDRQFYGFVQKQLGRPQGAPHYRPSPPPRPFRRGGRFILENKVDEDDEHILRYDSNVLNEDQVNTLYFKSNTLGFFRRLFRGIGRIARSIGNVASRVGKAVVKGVKDAAKAVVKAAKAVGKFFSKLFSEVQIKFTINAMVSAADLNNFVNYYSNNLDSFYVQFENLCTQKNKNIPAAIAAMENQLVQNSNKQATALLNKVLSKVSTKTTGAITAIFQAKLALVRTQILTAFVQIYNNINANCKCSKMISAAAADPTLSEKVGPFQDQINQQCDISCGKVIPPLPKIVDITKNNNQNDYFRH